MASKEELDKLRAYFTAMQSGGAKVLSNASQAKKILDAMEVDDPVDPPIDPPIEPPIEPPIDDDGDLPAGVTLREVDGGTDYFSNFPGVPYGANLFPIGVWYEGVYGPSDAQKDKGCGLNTYIELTSGSNHDIVRNAGMYAMPTAELSGGTLGSETIGWLTGDEVDMTAPGWWGAPHAAQFTELQRSIDALPKDGRLHFTNFGKGIIFTRNDAEAARMLKNYQDIVCSDIYWFTDNEAGYASQGGVLLGIDRDLTVAERKRASNYGATVQKTRKLLNYSKPSWGFVEVGGPFSYNNTADKYITPAQVRAAYWHSIIAGAQGIVFFNHSFGGPAQTQHALRDAYYAPVRTVVTELTALTQSLAAALHGPEAVGLVSHGADVLSLAKWNDGKPVIFAGSKENKASTATFTVAGSPTGTVTVLGENRTIPMVSGTFIDTFTDGNAIHLYQL